MEKVNHPDHYGKGKKDPYEVIKVIEAWELGFHLGNVIKYIPRAGKKDPQTEIEDLQKAKWYLKRRIKLLKKIKKINENHIKESKSIFFSLKQSFAAFKKRILYNRRQK